MDSVFGEQVALESDFKWLMLGAGHCVDLDRFQNDSRYADSCLRAAMFAPDEMLRNCAERIRASRLDAMPLAA